MLKTPIRIYYFRFEVRQLRNCAATQASFFSMKMSYETMWCGEEWICGLYGALCYALTWGAVVIING